MYWTTRARSTGFSTEAAQGSTTARMRALPSGVDRPLETRALARLVVSLFSETRMGEMAVIYPFVVPARKENIWRKL